MNKGGEEQRDSVLCIEQMHLNNYESKFLYFLLRFFYVGVESVGLERSEFHCLCSYGEKHKILTGTLRTLILRQQTVIGVRAFQLLVVDRSFTLILKQQTLTVFELLNFLLLTKVLELTGLS